MKKLNEKEWRTFHAFGDDGLFHITATSSSIDAIRLKDSGEKTVPYVTRSDVSNGIARFVGAENYDFGSDEGGCITVGLDTQTAFYQPHRFVTGQNVHIVTGKQLSEEVACFLVTILREQMQAKFNWGGNGATLGRMKRLLIMLPIDDDGKPDYDYMAQYVSETRRRMLTQYRVYAVERLSRLEYKDIPALSEKKWVDVELGRIADISSGRDIYAQERIAGDMPYITSGTANNGIGYFVGNDNDSKARNAISVNRNGAVGEAFYHPYEALYGNDCRRVNLHDTDDEAAQLFVAQCISKQKKAFSYSRKLGTARLNRLHVMLPVDDSGEPDYEYMGQYVRNIMLRKYRQYLAFLDSGAGRR